MGTAGLPPRVDELPEISLDAVRSVANASSVELDPELETRMASLIDEGNQELLRTSSGPGEGEVDEATARENLHRLIQAMVEDAYGRGTNVLDVESMNRAFGWLCPLPPWCR
jgi:hypothetical protein